MANKEQVKGVTAQREPIIVIPKPHNPARQFMSHAEALKDNEKRKRASEAAEAARLKVLNEGMEEETEVTGEKDSPSLPKPGKNAESQLSALKNELAQIEKQIQSKPTAALKKQKQKLEDKIEEIEAATE